MTEGKDRRVDLSLRERVNRLGLDPRIAREIADAKRQMAVQMLRLRTLELQVAVEGRRIV